MLENPRPAMTAIIRKACAPPKISPVYKRHTQRRRRQAGSDQRAMWRPVGRFESCVLRFILFLSNIITANDSTLHLTPRRTHALPEQGGAEYLDQ